MTDLICAHWTFAGIRNPLSLRDRARAAAEGGITRMGLALDDYRAARAEGLTPSELRRTVDEFGVRVEEIEFLRGWASTGDGPGLPGELVGALPWTEQERILLEMAETFEADHLNCGDAGFNGPLLPLEEVVDRFGGLCSRAAAVGLTVVLEPMPWTPIPDLATARDIVAGAGTANGGILLDTWHYFRAGGNAAVLETLDPGLIKLIQVDDSGPAQGDVFEDTMTRRLFPGDGEFDLVGLFTRLKALGVQAPVSVEVMSDVIETLTPAEAVARARTSTEALLDKVNWGQA
ncbi:MAG: hypothetical protein ABS81_04950 [Pseudonocardia sp. SCN 72-86]|nr:MAG: hypothetical protein ABS81_04950 [Pseudonocardia sp. SCN 72-86]